MKALLVIDVQNGLVDQGDFREEISLMDKMITDFNQDGSPVLFMKHSDEDEDSPLLKGSDGTRLHPSIEGYADLVIEKQTPSSFFNTDLSEELERRGVDHLFITGFNTEFCCMFTAIAAYDRGYEVTFVEDATATVNSGDTYEMAGLDIKDFVGTVLSWSDVIEVVKYEEYVEKYT
ncbi:isochorismatase family protein [Halobacillus salinus]|uniref:Isochorismatase family protein n=1 Tax=Halobacillus salinus TaxID=192814 RepID=A0A4Z0H284_9BACI|nr:isochorismatase family protein [Halobacillus salinus]TGB03516.1 isochorismatase family protein [Halobacillus salinus]